MKFNDLKYVLIAWFICALLLASESGSSNGVLVSEAAQVVLKSSDEVDSSTIRDWADLQGFKMNLSEALKVVELKEISSSDAAMLGAFRLICRSCLFSNKNICGLLNDPTALGEFRKKFSLVEIDGRRGTGIRAPSLGAKRYVNGGGKWIGLMPKNELSGRALWFGVTNLEYKVGDPITIEEIESVDTNF